MKNIIFNSIGTDPELFLVNENNEGVPSEEYFKGSKNRPTNIKGLGKGFSILCDNVMVEYNIPPCYNANEFIENNNKMLNWIKNYIPEYINIDISASKYFNPEKLTSRTAKEFGCSPDFNAWYLEQNIKPDVNTTLRSCGGHIHVGYSELDFDTSIKLIKLFDYFLGVPSIILDTDTERRKLYGNAGCFRLKDFGFEYRSLSNFWLKSDELMEWVYNQVQFVFDFYNENSNFEFLDSDEIVECINTQNISEAYRLIEKYNIQLPKLEVQENKNILQLVNVK